MSRPGLKLNKDQGSHIFSGRHSLLNVSTAPQNLLGSLVPHIDCGQNPEDAKSISEELKMATPEIDRRIVEIQEKHTRHMAEIRILNVLK